MSLDASDIFTFVALRSPEKIAPRAPRWRYIRDDAYHAPDTVPDAARMFGPRPEAYQPPGIHDVDLFSSDSPSSVGRRIAGDVVVGRPREEIIARSTT